MGEPTIRTRMRIASIAPIAAVGLLLAGCAPEPGPPPVTAPVITPIRSVFTGKQVSEATGTLTGAVHGTVTVVGTSGAGFSIRIDATHVSGTVYRSVELATSMHDVDCTPGRDGQEARRIDFGLANVTDRSAFSRPAVGSTEGDLSFMHVLVLADPAQIDYCDIRKMGISHLHWTRPAALSGLRAVDDGKTLAAMGDVIEEDGRPRQYEVARDDQIDTVARRLALTPDEIWYLNPRRTHGDTRTLFYDETLNLDPAAR